METNIAMSRRELWKSSVSEIRLMEQQPLDTDPYQNLANAIVAVAVDDYRFALREERAELKALLEEFFFSDWYKTLTNIDPNQIIDMVSEEIYLEMNPAQ